MLLAVCQKLEMETPGDIIPGIATGFAGGIGNTGATCGAVVGGVMAIGLARRRGEGLEGMMENLAVAGEFRRRFETEMGSIVCRELTGVDLTSPEGIEAFMGSDTPRTVCMPAVDTAYPSSERKTLNV